MQTVDGRERAVAYASKLLVGSERNWIHKTDGTSEIECWGIVWATRKFRYYLDRNEFDLYTDHKALTWVFNETNRTNNAKLAHWAMELSQLRFKVYHKPGTSMGHVDGLSRLHAATVCALTITDLLEGNSEDGLVEAEESSLSSRALNGSTVNATSAPSVLEESLRAAREALGEVEEPRAYGRASDALEENEGDGEVRANAREANGALQATREALERVEEPAVPVSVRSTPVEPDMEENADVAESEEERTAASPVDAFGLDRERFVDEQRHTP